MANQSGNVYKIYRKQLLSPERVRELSQLRPGYAIRDTLFSWFIIVIMWLLVAFYPAWWAVLIAIPMIGSRFYALFIIGHDGLHRRLFDKIERNDLFNDMFIMAPIGAITRINNLNHLKHHFHLATEGDPDRPKHACFNKTDHNELFMYLSGITRVFQTLYHVYIKPLISNQNSGIAKQNVNRLKRPVYRWHDIILLVVWQIGLLVGLTFAIGWWAYPILWLLPVYVFTFLADNLRSFIEHSHPEADDKADRHRLITHISNPIERAFLAPMNMNFHTVHHLWPSIPYYNLPIADAEIRNNSYAAGLEWRKTYLGYLWRYMNALPLEECKVQPVPLQSA